MLPHKAVHLQTGAEGNLQTCVQFPLQPGWAFGDCSIGTFQNFPLLLGYFYPSHMNQNVTYYTTVKILILAKLLLFICYLPKNVYGLFSHLRITFK